jgi:hypothetical protein
MKKNELMWQPERDMIIKSKFTTVYAENFLIIKCSSAIYLIFFGYNSFFTRHTRQLVVERVVPVFIIKPRL